MKQKSLHILLWGFLALFLGIAPIQAQEKKKNESNLQKKLKEAQKQWEKIQKKLEWENQKLRKKVRFYQRIFKRYQRQMRTPSFNIESMIKKAIYMASRLFRELQRMGPEKSIRLLKRILKKLLRRGFRPPRGKSMPMPYRRPRKLTPDMKARMLYVQGSIAFRKKEYTKAKNLFSQAIKLSPGRGVYYFSRANVYLFNKQYKKAKTDLLKTIALSPDNGSAYYNIACIYALQNQKDQAFKWLKKSLHHGFKNTEHMKKDSDLKSLHGDPRFENLLKKKWK